MVQCAGRTRIATVTHRCGDYVIEPAEDRTLGVSDFGEEVLIPSRPLNRTVRDDLGNRDLCAHGMKRCRFDAGRRFGVVRRLSRSAQDRAVHGLFPLMED